MTRFADSFAFWLGDYYLLSTILLALALIGITALKQPAQRLAITKATLVALALLAALCALPRWSAVHLISADPQQQSQLSESPTLQFDANQPAHSVPVASSRVRTPESVTSVEPAPNIIAPAHDWPKISWPAILAIVHLCGAIGVMAWLSVGSFAARGLRLSAKPAPAEIAALLAEISASRRDAATWSSLSETRNQRSPKQCQCELKLLVSDRISVPVALGIRRPTILLPTIWEDSSRDQLRSVLAHELTHIRNRDLSWLTASRALLVLLWAQPLYWYLRRRMRLDQEALADAAAAEIAGRQRYAEQLVAWARDLHIRPVMRLSSAVGLWEGPSQLRQRIGILLNERFTVLRNCSRGWRIAAGILAIAAAMSLSTVTLQPTSRADESSPTEKAATAAAVPAAAAPDGPTDESKGRPDAKRYRREPNEVNGRVLDDKDQPISGAEVFLSRVNTRDGTRTLLGKKSTDAEGRFRFDNVFDIDKEFPGRKFPGPFEVGDLMLEGAIRAPSRVTARWWLMRQNVGKTGEYHEVKMLPAATLRGRVTDPSGKPVVAALVSVGNLARWDVAQTGRTDADGYYKVDDAPPFDEVEFKKQVAEQERQRKDEEARGIHSFRVFARQPILKVEHPDYALKQTTLDRSPGTKDVQLEPAAVLEGRVIFADSGKPAAGALVGIATSVERRDPPIAPPLTDIRRLYVRTDADGKYHVESLASGKYELWAETPGWVNVGTNDVVAVANRTSVVPDLKFTKGGVVSARLVDAKTHESIAIPTDARVMMLVRPVLERPSFRRVDAPFITANSQGRFELQLTPGKKMLGAGGVEIDGDMKFSGPPTTEMNVVEGKNSNVDLPVEEIKITNAANGEVKQAKSGTGSVSNSVEKSQSTSTDGTEKNGSQMLRDLRKKSVPLLAAMAKDHGYGLPDGKDVLRVPPPFAPIRMEWYRVANPTQAEAIPRGPSAMLFRWSRGRLESFGMTFGDPVGDSVGGVLGSVLGVKDQEVDGHKSFLKTIVPGDWVVRKGVKREQLVKQLQTILQDECSLHVKLEFREVNRPVYVARGDYKITPPPGYKAKGTLILTDKTLTTDEIQIYGKELVPDSGSGGGTGRFDEFLSWLGRWIDAPVVSDVKSPPKSELSWKLHGRSPFTDQMRHEDHDPKLVLEHISEQTGLTFTLENRPVQILFVDSSGEK